jgi:aldose sugar dehydrogenase
MRLLPRALMPLIVLAAACASSPSAEAPPDDQQVPPGMTGTAPIAEPGGTGPVPLGDLVTVADGLEVPWDIAFLDDDTLFVTERPGRVRVIDNGRLRPDPVATFDVTDQGEAGLMGIAVHPDVGQERYIYVAYTADDGNRVIRAAIGDDLTFGNEETLIEGIPAARFHDGGGLAFGPDGMLYILTGDAGEPDAAAELTSLAGKVLRLRPDGTIPDDNPFPGSAVWSYGHRNPQGLDWDATGRLLVSEHGPSGDLSLCCHDEVNLVMPGAFYGWPFSAGMVSTSQEGAPPAQTVRPVATSGEDTWAPSGLAVQPGTHNPAVFFVANLRGATIRRGEVAAGRIDEPVDTQVVYDGLGRMRAAAFGPDGCLYVTTSNRDGRGQVAEGDDRLLKACPT